MSETIEILLGADQNHAPLLLMAVKSLVSSSRAPSALNLTVMDRGIPEEIRQALLVYGESGNASVGFVGMRDEALLRERWNFPDCFFRLPGSGHYDRLAAPYLIAGPRVLYLDADVLVRTDLTPLFAADLEGFAVAAVQDQNISRIGDKCGLVDWEARRLDPDLPYFNSGVMVIDLDRWREEDYCRHCCEAALAFLEQHRVPPPLFDQYALNTVFLNAWKKLDLKWNRFSERIDSLETEAAIVHFAGRGKPLVGEGNLSRSAQYFAREALRLLGDDWEETQQSGKFLRRLEQHHQNLEKLRALARSPNGNPLTFAGAADLATEPDEGTVVMVIPVMLRDTSSLRYRNFQFLLHHYSRHFDHVVVAEQVIGTTRGSLPERSGVHWLRFDLGDESIHKSTLVNRAAEHAFTKLGARYVCQMDADIFVPPQALLRLLSVLSSESIPVVRPFIHFIRIDEERSAEILAFGDADADRFDPAQEHVGLFRIIDLFGPGCVVYSRSAFETTGGLDESFTGWGWEDMEFAERLAAFKVPHTLPLVGCHLHHEEDRRPQEENFVRFCRLHHPDRSEAEIRHIHVHTVFYNYLHKFCILSFGGPEALAPLVNEIHAVGNVALFDSPIRKSSLPPERHLADDVAKRVIYTLVSGGRRIAGLVWRPADRESDPVTRLPIDEGLLLDFLVASGFRILLIAPDIERNDARTAICFRRAKETIARSCRFHGSRFPSLVCQASPAALSEAAERKRCRQFLLPEETDS